MAKRNELITYANTSKKLSELEIKLNSYKETIDILTKKIEEV